MNGKGIVMNSGDNISHRNNSSLLVYLNFACLAAFLACALLVDSEGYLVGLEAIGTTCIVVPIVTLGLSSSVLMAIRNKKYWFICVLTIAMYAIMFLPLLL